MSRARRVGLDADLDAIARRLDLLERRPIASDPVGVIAFLGLPVVPAGWIVLDGTTVGPEYPVLRQALLDAGSPHGFSSGNPHRPNAINRVLIGSGGTYALGASGGEATMTAALMPSHQHDSGTLTANPVGNHRHFGTVTTGTGGWGGPTDGVPQHNGTVAGGQPWQTSLDGAHGHSISGLTAAHGSGGTGNNLPPYVGALPIMRAY